MAVSHVGILFYAWSLALGSLTYYSLPIEPGLIPLVILTTCMGVCLLLLRGLTTRFHLVRKIVIIAIVFVCGMIAAKVHTNNQTALPRLEGTSETYIFKAVIEDLRRDWSGRYNLVVRPISSGGRLSAQCRYRIKASARFGDDIETGGYRRFKANLYGFYAPAYPNGWDSARQFWLQGLCGQGFVREINTLDPDDLRSESTAALMISSLKRQLYAIRLGIGEIISRYMPAYYASVAKAMTVGIRDQDELSYTAWRNAGMAHLLAISGLHMGIVFIVSFVAIRRLILLIPVIRFWPSVKTLAACLAIAVASSYLLLSGASISALRAYAMALMAMFVIIVDRSSNVMRLLGFVMIGMILFNPEFILFVGFQLSYLAVTGLALFLRPHEDKDGNAQAIIPEFPIFSFSEKAGVVFKASAIANIMSLPIILYHFQTITLLGFFTNMIAIPATALWLVPALLVGIIGIPFGLEGIGFLIAEQGMALLSVIVDTSNRLTILYGNLARPPGYLVVLWLGAFCALASSRPVFRTAAVCCLVLLVILYVGQSRPVAIISGSESAVMLRDGNGLSSNRHNLAQFEQEQWLSYLGVPFAQHRLWDDFADGSDYNLECVDRTCTYRFRGRQLSFVFGESLQCPPGEVIVYFISQAVTDICPRAKIMVDNEERLRLGTLFFYPTDVNWRIKTTQESRKQRPWFTQPYR